MEFRKLEIKNFRNFKNMKIDLNNKNIIFGLNNVGKSNLIFALRLLFDWSLRTYEIVDTDFFDMNTKENIEIICEISLSNKLGDDEQKILAKLGNSATKSNTVFLKLLFNYYNSNGETKQLFWGMAKDKLVPVTGTLNTNDIYRTFEVVFISPTSNVDDIFKTEKRNFFKMYDNLLEEDESIDKEINNKIAEINNNIASLPRIQQMQGDLNKNLQNFDNGNYQVVITSDFAIKGYEKELSIFMKDKNNDEKVYPVAGDGVKKKVAYALIDLLKNKEQDRKVILYLIEEPENHLFYSTHSELARNLLKNDAINYMFLVTHSPIYINYYQKNDGLNLIKLTKLQNSISAHTSYFKVSEIFPKWQQTFLQDFTTAMFYDKVFLVEGYSEEVLFSRILKETGKDLNIYILKVLSTNFTRYFDILFDLGIKVFIKTDNDIRISNNKIEPIGLERIEKLYDSKYDKEPSFNKIENKEKAKNVDLTDEQKIKYKYQFYNDNNLFIELAQSKNIYLSKVDLENDLAEAIDDDRIKELLDKTNSSSKKSGVKWLQEAKWHNMIKLSVNLTSEDIKKIKEHRNFLVIKDILKSFGEE